MKDNSRRRALLAMVAGSAGVAACATDGSAQAPVGAHRGAMADILTRLDRAESKQAVAETLYAYARACDRGDEALMRTCFWPESTHKHGRYEGSSTGFVDFSFKIINSLKYAVHRISNVSIDLRGDRAFSECYYLAHHRRVAASGGEEDVYFEGRYLDIHERRAGVWKIIRRRGMSDFTSTPAPASTPYASWPAGHSDKAPSDEYYAMRDAFLAGH